MDTFTRQGIADDLCQLGLTRREANALIACVLDTMVEYLEHGETVKISGLGNFTLRDKSARQARNPATGESALIEARRVVTFRASKKLRKRLGSVSDSS